MKGKTVKQIIASISILVVTYSALNLVKTKAEEGQVNHYISVMSATKIEDNELFKYALDTNLNNIIAFGEVEAVGSVSMDNLEGNYMVVEKVQEEEHMKTRTVSYSCGKDDKDTCYKTETYWEWDVIGREYASVSDVKFMGIQKPIEEYYGINTSYNSTYKHPNEWFKDKRRDKFYTVELSFEALVHLDNKDNLFNLKRSSLENYTDVSASMGWFAKFVMIGIFLVINGMSLCAIWIEYEYYFV